MSNQAKLPIDKQKELLNYFTLTDIEMMHAHFKICFQMGAFETISDLGENERAALFSLYYFTEFLDKLKQSVSE